MSRVLKITKPKVLRGSLELSTHFLSSPFLFSFKENLMLNIDTTNETSQVYFWQKAQACYV